MPFHMVAWLLSIQPSKMEVHGLIRTQQICCDPLPPLLFSPLILPLRAVTLHTSRFQTPHIRGSTRLVLTAVVRARILEELTRVAQSLLTLTLPLLAPLLFHTLLLAARALLVAVAVRRAVYARRP